MSMTVCDKYDISREVDRLKVFYGRFTDGVAILREDWVFLL